MVGKYILVLLNENNFLKHKFEDETMQKESSIYWFSLTPSVATEQAVEVKRIDVERYEGLAGVTFLEQTNSRGFSLKNHSTREINYSDGASDQTQITYELSYDQMHYIRRTYALLDLLADLGGLTSSLALLSLSIV